MAVLKKHQYHDLVNVNFSENYTCVVQDAVLSYRLDAVQSYHWNATSVTVHPFLCYHHDPGECLQHKCYVIISEHTEHDTVAVLLFQRKLIQFLTETFYPCS